MRINHLRPGLAAAGALCLAALGGCGPMPDPRVTIVAFGDSSTSGPSQRDYVDYLPELTGIDGAAWAKEGNGGEVTAEGVVRLRDILEFDLFPNAEVLLFWEGGNDLVDFVSQADPLLVLPPGSDSYPFADQLGQLLDDVQTNIEQAIQLGQDAGLTVAVATYFFMPESSTNCDPLLLDILLPFQSTVANGYTTLLNERIREAARNRGAILIDVASIADTLRADPDNYENCNHLSAKGNALVAELFRDTILNLRS